MQKEQVEKVPYRNKERYDENPFMKELKISLIRKTKSEQFGNEQIIVNQSTGEFEGVPVMLRKRKVDANQFVKMYISTMKAWLNLSPKAQKMLRCIITQMKPNKDVVHLELNSEEIKMTSQLKSKVSMYGGLDELIDRHIIAKGKYSDQFYINPNVMFSGNRMVFIDAIEMAGNGSQVRNVLNEPVVEVDKNMLEEH